MDWVYLDLNLDLRLWTWTISESEDLDLPLGLGERGLGLRLATMGLDYISAGLNENLDHHKIFMIKAFCRGRPQTENSRRV